MIPNSEPVADGSLLQNTSLKMPVQAVGITQRQSAGKNITHELTSVKHVIMNPLEHDGHYLYHTFSVSMALHPLWTLAAFSVS
jgi:tryptophan synthase alpha subunit